MLRAAAICLFALPVFAEPTEISVPVRHLKLKPGLDESERGLMEAFPYIAGKQGVLKPETLPRFLKEDIASKEAAIEAVRLFAAGPLVRDEAKAKVMIEAGKLQVKKLKHLKVKVLDHRPKSYAPTATKWKDGWHVSLVAFEMDNMLRLVHIEAVVRSNGLVKLKRKPIVDGPMTSWQTAMISTASAAEQVAAVKREQEMRREALRARKAYAKALAPARDLDTAWAIARLRLSASQIADLWRPHDRVVGSGVYLVAYFLKDGSAVIFDAGDKRRRVLRTSHVREAPGPMKVGPTLHVLSRG